MTPEIKAELVGRAQEMVAHEGLQALLDHRHLQGPCACMGPQDGASLCPCAQSAALAENLPVIVDTIDPEAARRLMLRRLVAAMPG